MANNPFVPQVASSSGSSGNRWITNPKQLPITVVNQSNFYLKTAIGASTNCSAANATTFFNAMALKGAQASVAVADTYVTFASLTGSGLLFNVVCATNTGAGYTPTLRITVDGVVYIITSSGALSAVQRLVVGAIVPALPSISAVATIGTDIVSPNAGADVGFQSASVGGLMAMLNNCGITSPENIMAYNMPMLRFEQSLLVEMKTSLLASSTGDRLGGVSYRLEV